MNKITTLSSAELNAMPFLSSFGFIPCHETFSATFYDKHGMPFKAKPDYYNPVLDIYAEVKYSSLNSKTSKQSADNAYERLDPWQQAMPYHQVNCQWSHAAAKQGIVQATLGPASFVILFVGEPSQDTLKLIEKHGIDAYSLDRLPWYLLRRQLGQY